MDTEKNISAAILDENKEYKLTETELKEKREKIRKTTNELKKIFCKLDKNTLKLVENIIQELAFMSVTLEENRKYIEEHGVKEIYMNGRGQFGYKESVESKNYNAMIKNYTNLTKEIINFLPKSEKKGAGEDLLKFIAGGNK